MSLFSVASTRSPARRTLCHVSSDLLDGVSMLIFWSRDRAAGKGRREVAMRSCFCRPIGHRRAAGREDYFAAPVTYNTRNMRM